MTLPGDLHGHFDEYPSVISKWLAARDGSVIRLHGVLVAFGVC